MARWGAQNRRSPPWKCENGDFQEALFREQTRVLRGQLRRWPREGPPATEDHAGSRQAVCDVSKPALSRALDPSHPWETDVEEEESTLTVLVWNAAVTPSGPRTQRSRFCPSSAGSRSTEWKSGCWATWCPGSAPGWWPSCKVSCRATRARRRARWMEGSIDR